MLGVACKAQNEDEKKLEEPIRFVAFVPQTKRDVHDELVDKAIELVENGQFLEALERLDEAERLEPPDHFVLNMRGVTFTKLQQWDKAEQYFKRAIEAAPGFFPARFNFGEMLFLQQKKEEALHYFEVLNYSFPRNELIEFKLVMLFCVTGRMEDAKRTASRMMFPGDSPAWYCAQAAIFFKEGNYQEAMRYVRTAERIFGERQMKIFWEGLEVSGLTKL